MKIPYLIRSTCLVASSLTVLSQAFAGTPVDGLTVAISPDGSQLVTAGDTRTLYVLDPASLEVKSRTWVETTVDDMSYNKDGSILAIHDTNDTVELRSTSDWSVTKTVENASSFTASQISDTAASYNSRDQIFNVWSLSDGSEKKSIKIAERARIAAMTLNSDASKLAVLFQSATDESEKKVNYSDIPKDLKGVDRKRFQQENDGYTSKFVIYDIGSGEASADLKIFYRSSGGTQMGFVGDNVVVVNYSNENVSISPDGTIEMFELPSSYNYGIGFSTDNSVVVGGGLANGSIMKTADKSTVEFRIDKLKGWPEYFKDFCTTSEGVTYGTTSGYRIIKIGSDGKVLEQKPVY